MSVCMQEILFELTMIFFQLFFHHIYFAFFFSAEIMLSNWQKKWFAVFFGAWL